MDDIVKKYALKGVFVYLDNITIAGKTQQEHDKSLNKLNSVITELNLTLNPDKCVYSTTSVDLLGYTISFGSIKPNSDRMQPLLGMPLPTCKKALDRTLGLFAYYSKWVHKYSEKASPVFKAITFPLGKAAVYAFTTLKEEIANAVVSNVGEDVPFEVETDASDNAIAAALNQNGRPVAFFSRVLNPSEQKHSSVEKEACAIVEALRKWKHFLTGRHFTIITDQKCVRLSSIAPK